MSDSYKESNRFVACLAFVLDWEGGFVNNPKDPGGATNMGITQRTLSSWRRCEVTVEDVKALTLAEARAIYMAHYWNTMRCDMLPVGLDLAVLDFGVNSGRRRSGLGLQRLLMLPEKQQDGVIGPQTLRMVDLYLPKGRALMDRLCDYRLTFLKGLDTWGTFGKGWTFRVEALRRQAVRDMAE